VSGFCECGNEFMGSINKGNFSTEHLLAAQEGLCSMESVNYLLINFYNLFNIITYCVN